MLKPLALLIPPQIGIPPLFVCLASVFALREKQPKSESKSTREQSGAHTHHWRKDWHLLLQRPQLFHLCFQTLITLQVRFSLSR